MDVNTLEEEISLDPENWSAMRELGHQMVDDMMSYLETVRERPAWQPIPQAVKDNFKQAVPTQPTNAESVYQEFLDNILPYPLGNIHPRFWGWVLGTGTPIGMMAEMLASGMNCSLGGGEQIAVDVEMQVIEWMKDVMGFPMDSSGLLVSGGSMANLVGLTVARNTLAGYDVRSRGVRDLPRPMTIYCSQETHSSIQKAAEILGLGSESVRRIPVNKYFEIDVAALEVAILEDKAKGFQPFCIVGNIGTTNTAAIDDLDLLADIAEREGMWFHIDGAFGALAVLTEHIRPGLKGMERADSLAFDLHKWMYVPYEVGCVLVQNEEKHRRAFSLTPDYLARAERGISAAKTWLSDYGIQLSREFRALKVWMSIKTHGMDAYGQLIQQNIEQARYVASLIDEYPELERLAPVTLNVVNFRYVREGLSEEELNQLNDELLMDLQESGVAAPTSTMLKGKYAIRVAVTNHRSKREDFALFIDKVLELGRKVPT